LVKRGKSVFCY